METLGLDFVRMDVARTGNDSAKQTDVIGRLIQSANVNKIAATARPIENSAASKSVYGNWLIPKKLARRTAERRADGENTSRQILIDCSNIAKNAVNTSAIGASITSNGCVRFSVATTMLTTTAFWNETAVITKHTKNKGWDTPDATDIDLLKATPDIHANIMVTTTPKQKRHYKSIKH
jgi:hypothetical protein